MTSLAELEQFLVREAERLPSEEEARAIQLTAASARMTRTTSLPFGVSIGTAAFAVLVVLFLAPVLWIGLRNTSQIAGGSNGPDVSAAADGQITAEAFQRACPDCDDSGHLFVITDLYESGSPLSELIRPMAGKSVQSISTVVPDAVFVEADTDEATAAYEEAGNRRAVVVTFSPVTYAPEASATVSVGVIWGSSVTETSVKFHWNGSEWVYSDMLPPCRRSGSDDAC